ncbi:MAG: hypothetical protein K2O46_07635, partial [Bacteroidales bacterium]|nr:hypothetical protein [Bacteroidales bacterium]
MNAEPATLVTDARPALLGLSPAEIADRLADAPFPAYRAKQVAQWIYGKRADSFDAMSNLGRADRE